MHISFWKNSLPPPQKKYRTDPRITPFHSEAGVQFQEMVDTERVEKNVFIYYHLIHQWSFEIIN